MTKKFLTPIVLPADPTALMEAATKQYVDTKVAGGGGTSEVWIGTADPGDSTTELWYDTDEPNLYEADTARWNSAWGVVTYAQVVANQTGISTVADLTGLTVTFTPVVGRRYLISASMLLQQMTSAGGIYAEIKNPTSRVQWRSSNVAASAYVPIELDLVETFATTTAVTRKVTLMTSAGTVNLNAAAAYPAFIMVEDIGPTIYSPAPAPPQYPTPWTAATYQNGWTSLDARVAQYRKVGDIVELRGVVQAGTIGWGTAAFTLPVGFRPTNSSMSFPVNCQGGVGSCDVFSDGRVSLGANTAGSMPTGAWAYIDPVRFSVTA